MAIGEGPFLEVLGVAQDAGVPQAACVSPNCEAARADPRRRAYATSLALIGSKGESYLFEATPDIRPQLDRVMELGKERGRPDAGRRYLDGIFVTHAHMGHYSGLLHLGFEAAHSQEVPLYGSPKMLAFIEGNQPWKQLVELRNLVLRPLDLDPSASVELSDGIKVSPVSVPHRDELSDTVAWRIEGPTHTVLFLPDCDPWQRWEARGFDWVSMLDGVDTLLVDATFYSEDELPGRDLSKIGHPLVTDSIELLREREQAGQLRVFFIHFNHSNPLLTPDSDARKRVEAAGFEIAERGLQLAL